MSGSSNNCPICDFPMIEDISYGEGIIHEARLFCRNCGDYSRDFAYGFTEYGIGGFVVQHNYQMTEADIQTAINQVTEAIVFTRQYCPTCLNLRDLEECSYCAYQDEINATRE